MLPLPCFWPSLACTCCPPPTSASVTKGPPPCEPASRAPSAYRSAGPWGRAHPDAETVTSLDSICEDRTCSQVQEGGPCRLGNTMQPPPPPAASEPQSLRLQRPLGWAAHWQAPPWGSELLPAPTSAKGSRGVPGVGGGQPIPQWKQSPGEGLCPPPLPARLLGSPGTARSVSPRGGGTPEMPPLQVPDQLCYLLRKSQAPGWWPRVIGTCSRPRQGTGRAPLGGWAASPEADGRSVRALALRASRWLPGGT